MAPRRWVHRDWLGLGTFIVKRFIVPLSLFLFAAMGIVSAVGAELPWIRVADDRRGFVHADSGRPFVPWGFNYDHDERGRLIEDYWQGEWPKVEQDFAEMKELGANVVRVHLQLGKFMQAADTPDQKSLDQLARLLKLAERTGLYLDLTGLGCYHKRDVPEWYDKLAERERWDVQARFWEAVAARAAESPAVFCYDLMNEPLALGGAGKRSDWLGPAFGDKHFVQYVALETKGRARHEIARQWIAHLAKAIHKHDRRHLITVGLVPWSLDRPGLSSGFIPDKIAGELDFISVHIYPEKAKLDEAIETLKGFAIGKPVVIEEMFPLRCSAGELGQFIDKSQGIASGWIGFYWGKTPAEYREPKTIADRLTLDWLELFEKMRARMGVSSP
jgi:hypothetical protein